MCAASRSSGTPKTYFAEFSWARQIEAVAVGNCFLRKEDQDPALKERDEGKFDLDGT